MPCTLSLTLCSELARHEDMTTCDSTSGKTGPHVYMPVSCRTSACTIGKRLARAFGLSSMSTCLRQGQLSLLSKHLASLRDEHEATDSKHCQPTTPLPSTKHLIESGIVLLQSFATFRASLSWP